jgi:hypothetical protein
MSEQNINITTITFRLFSKKKYPFYLNVPLKKNTSARTVVPK